MNVQTEESETAGLSVPSIVNNVTTRQHVTELALAVILQDCEEPKDSPNKDSHGLIARYLARPATRGQPTVRRTRYYAPAMTSLIPEDECSWRPACGCTRCTSRRWQ